MEGGEKGGKRVGGGGGGGGGRRKERGGSSQSTHMYMVRIIPRLNIHDMQLAVVCGKIHMTVCNLQTTFMSRKSCLVTFEMSSGMAR